METKKFDWASLVLGILFILASLAAFKNPDSDLIAVGIIFGVAAIVKGISEILFRRQLHYFVGFKSTGLLVLGIIDIIIGAYLLFNMQATMVALPYVFAIWFIIDSIMMIVTSDGAKLVSNSYYYFTIIGGVIGIILGISLLFDPLVSALTLSFLVGFYFMWTGIVYITNAFTK